jgi:hypothetical protein
MYPSHNPNDYTSAYDPNQGYDYTGGYDPNQGYTGAYDPNQGYTGAYDPNQGYDYTGGYDPNQEYAQTPNQSNNQVVTQYTIPLQPELDAAPAPVRFSVTLTFDIDANRIPDQRAYDDFDQFLTDVTNSLYPRIGARVHAYFAEKFNKEQLPQLQRDIKQFYEEHLPLRMSKQQFARYTYEHFIHTGLNEGVINIMLAQAANMPLNTYKMQLAERWKAACAAGAPNRNRVIHEANRDGFMRVFTGEIVHLPHHTIKKMLGHIEARHVNS